MVVKKEKQILESVGVDAISSDGRGISKMEGKVLFTDFAIPGDVVDVAVYRHKKNYSEGHIAQIVSASLSRVEPVCSHFGICGGCKWQHVTYREQLNYKRQIVNDAFQKIGKVDFPSVPEVIGCTQDYYYRNKLEFAFTDRRWLTDEEIGSGTKYEHRNGLGFHVPGSFSGVIDVAQCYLQADPSNQIRQAVKEFALQNQYGFFDLKEQKGLLRNLLIRISSIGEILVLLSFSSADSEKIDLLLNYIRNKFPDITSLLYVINSKRNDTIYDLPVHVFSGRNYIIEQLGGLQFKIGPKSFFQTNSKQAEVLYQVVRDFAALKKDDVVYDLFTGVGSIALYLSSNCKQVVGIELIEDAIKDAEENARLNNIINCRFETGDVRKLLNHAFIQKYGSPDIVITDPPRAGMHEDVVNTLLELMPPVIVYVSCNAATQARDIQLLSSKYEVTKLQPVDMFPQTTHIENVARLERKADV